MGTTLSTLSNLAIYIGLVVVGAFLGSRKALRSRPLVWVGKLQFAALMILIVTLGVNLGANDEVVSSRARSAWRPGDHGAGMALAPCCASPCCGGSCSSWTTTALPRGSEAAGRRRPTTAARRTTPSPSSLSLPWCWECWAGRFVLPAAVTAHCGTVISFGLYLLLFMVGMDMGKQGTLLADIKTAGFQVLLVPVAVCAGSLAFAALPACTDCP